METETGNINSRLLSTLNYTDNHSIIYRVRSQPKGRETRSVLMSILHTLNACCTQPAERVVLALNHYANDRNENMFARLFGGLPLFVPT